MPGKKSYNEKRGLFSVNWKQEEKKRDDKLVGEKGRNTGHLEKKQVNWVTVKERRRKQ